MSNLRIRWWLAPGAAALTIVAALGASSADAAGARLFKSGPIQITADGSTVWVVNPDHDTVSRIDTATDIVSEFALPNPAKDSPRGLSVTEDGAQIWVACHDSDRVLVLDGTTGAAIDVIDLPWGSGPHSIALSRDQTKALVTLHRTEAIAWIDVPTRTLQPLIEPTYHHPLGIAWMEDGVSAWVSHIFADGEHPYITQVRFGAQGPEVVSKVRLLATHPQRDSQTSPEPAEGGYLTTRGHIAQIPTATGLQQLYVPTQYNNIHNDSWSPDSTVQSTIRHVDLGTRLIPEDNLNKVIFSAVSVHDPLGANPYQGAGWDAGVSGPIDIGFSADGTIGYVVHELSNDVLVFPTNTPAVKPGAAAPLDEIDVGSRPLGIAMSPTSDIAYVANHFSRDVSVLDLAQAPPVEVRRIASATGPEPMPPSVLRGAQLFHTSADPRISANDKVSCASCHLNAEHDGRPWDFQNLPGAHGHRSVQTLLGLNLTFGPPDPASGFGQLHLSGDRDEIQDFDHTFQGVNFGGTGFLGGGACAELDPLCLNAGRDPDLDAIADYILSLEPLARSPQRDPATGQLTEAATRGLTFFLGTDRANQVADSGCVACHLPPAGPGAPGVFADGLFHDIGLRPGNENELNNRGAPWTWAMNTQTLNGVWATPPWEGGPNWATSSMINVFQAMQARASSGTPHGTPDGLTGRQLLDLQEFVKSLDGNTNVADMAQRDTSPPRILRVEPASLTQLDVWFSESVDGTTAADPANYQLVRVGDMQVMPLSNGRLHPGNGDRVTFDTALEDCADYELLPVGPIYDIADSATGGVRNALDQSDVKNVQGFTIDGSITVTMGLSGYENIDVPVHDAAMVNSQNNRSWGHDSVYIHGSAGSSRATVGFVRFDWETEFERVTGVTDENDIVDASFTLTGDFGDQMTLEIRHMLLQWADPPTGGDWDNNPPGAPTWNSHAHPSGWNQAGAAALGGTGKVVADYNGSFDRAATVDLTIVPPAVNQPVVFASPAITDGFKFWFQNRTANPPVDWGYALEVVNGSQELRYHNPEWELGQHGPYMTVTYQLPAATPGEVSGRAGSTPLYLAKTAGPEVLFSFEDLAPAASMYNVYEGVIGSYYSHAAASCGLVAPLAGGRRELLHVPPAGDTYFVVTGSSCQFEGPSDVDHPPGLLNCPN